MRLYRVLLYFLQTTLHVSDDTLIHHQEHIQTVITTSDTGRTFFVTIHWHGGFGTAVPDPPLLRTVANTVRPVPEVVITVWVCSWWWIRVSSETCRAVCRKHNKTVYSRILLDNYWHWFTIHVHMNIKFMIWTWRMWLIAGPSGSLLWIRYWIFVFHERQGISRPVTWLLVSQTRSESFPFVSVYT